MEALKNGRIQYACEDGSREFISLLACISADGTALPPSLIYKGRSGSLQDTWLEDWVPNEQAHFAASPNGWSCNVLGLNWLQTVFDRYTHTKAGNRRRLLIVDGYSSHVNMAFITECDRLRILLMILPLYLTHRLQPLDVSLFRPLATQYTNGLNNLMFKSLGLVSMTKRSFWQIFWPAWQHSFTVKNISSGFKKTGIWPLKPGVLLDQITLPPLPIADNKPQIPKTPMTSRDVQCFQKAYKADPNPDFLEKLFRANLILATQHEIDRHVEQGLIGALKDEKKRRRRGKKLNLLGEEGSGPQFFSPTRIQAARDYQESKQTNEALRQQAVNDKKSAAACQKIIHKNKKKSGNPSTKSRRTVQAAPTAKSASLPNITAAVIDLTGPSVVTEKLQKSSKKAGKQRKTEAQTVSSRPTAPEQEIVISGKSRTRIIVRPNRYND